MGDKMDLKEYTGKPCRAKVAYEFLPKKTTKLDLEKEANEIEKTFPIEIRSKVLLIIKVEDKTVSLFSSGKLLVRGERDEEEAKKIAIKIVTKLKG
jgi:ArsR family metal-binding transcriptional regulator